MTVDPRELCYKDRKGKGRVLSIDYGDKRIGVALSDINWQIASPLKVFESRGVFKDLVQTLIQNEVNIIIIGFPKSLSGVSSGMQLDKVEKFIKKLEEVLIDNHLDIPVITWDERLSTVAAHRVLEESSVNKRNRKQYVDKIAASFILQGFLDWVLYNPA